MDQKRFPNSYKTIFFPFFFPLLLLSCFYPIPDFYRILINNQIQETQPTILPNALSVNDVKLTATKNGTSWCAAVYQDPIPTPVYKLALYKIAVENGIPKSSHSIYSLGNQPLHSNLLSVDEDTAYFVYNTSLSPTTINIIGKDGYVSSVPLGGSFITAALTPENDIACFTINSGTLLAFKYFLNDDSSEPLFASMSPQITFTDGYATSAIFNEDGSCYFAYFNATLQYAKIFHDATTNSNLAQITNTPAATGPLQLAFHKGAGEPNLIFLYSYEIRCQRSGSDYIYLDNITNENPIYSWNINEDFLGVVFTGSNYVYFRQYRNNLTDGLPLSSQNITVSYPLDSASHPAFCEMQNNGTFRGILLARYDVTNAGMRFTYFSALN